MIKEDHTKIQLPEEDGYYTVNGNKVLYFQEGVWYKALKYMGRYNGSIQPLEKQPSRIKTIEKFHVWY